jgi:hypothetical protein
MPMPPTMPPMAWLCASLGLMMRPGEREQMLPKVTATVPAFAESQAKTKRHRETPAAATGRSAVVTNRRRACQRQHPAT